jgi:hypothetical protein
MEAGMKAWLAAFTVDDVCREENDAHCAATASPDAECCAPHDCRTKVLAVRESFAKKNVCNRF